MMSERKRIHNLSEIGALQPQSWASRGRLSVEGRLSSQPFSYLVNNKIIYIHDFRSGEVFSYLPNGVLPEIKEYARPPENRQLSEDKLKDYNALPMATNNLYMIKKNIYSNPFVKEGSMAELVIPMYDSFRRISSLQRIYKYGKRFEAGYPTKGLFYTDTVLDKGLKKLWLCEGYATYRTLKKHIPYEGLCCFSKSNMLFMEARIKEYGWEILVMHDLDDTKYDTSPPVLSDWNDCEKRFGFDKTKIYIEEVLNA